MLKTEFVSKDGYKCLVLTCYITHMVGLFVNFEYVSPYFNMTNLNNKVIIIRNLPSIMTSPSEIRFLSIWRSSNAMATSADVSSGRAENGRRAPGIP